MHELRTLYTVGHYRVVVASYEAHNDTGLDGLVLGEGATPSSLSTGVLVRLTIFEDRTMDHGTIQPLHSAERNCTLEEAKRIFQELYGHGDNIATRYHCLEGAIAQRRQQLRTSRSKDTFAMIAAESRQLIADAHTQREGIVRQGKRWGLESYEPPLLYQEAELLQLELTADPEARARMIAESGRRYAAAQEAQAREARQKERERRQRAEESIRPAREKEDREPRAAEHYAPPPEPPQKPHYVQPKIPAAPPPAPRQVPPMTSQEVVMDPAWDEKRRAREVQRAKQKEKRIAESKKNYLEWVHKKGKK